MRSVFLFALSILVVCSCGPSSDEGQSVTPEESSIDSRFQDCYFDNGFAEKRANSVLIDIFGKRLFEKHVRLHRKESTMNCQIDSNIRLVQFGDSSCCLPNSFELAYSVIDKGEKIFEFQMISGKDMKFEVVSEIIFDQLEGYKKLLNGELNISYSKALSLSKKHDAYSENHHLELAKSNADSLVGNNAYFWEMELAYNDHSFAILFINAMSGDTRLIRDNQILSIDCF